MERPSATSGGFFHGRDFASDEELNAWVLGWLDKVAAVRVHGTLRETGYSRLREKGRTFRFD
ncbi:MAG: hypothetical protein OXU74_01370 [Gemmatimonadota bacterium]|nr:hypothetical protein [Gemmatimonadota bacterium]